MNRKDLNMLSEAYQKVLEEVVNTGGELPDLDMKMSTGNLDKFDKSNLYTQQDDREEKNDSFYNQAKEAIRSSISGITQQIQKDAANQTLDPRQMERFLKEFQNQINLDIEAAQQKLKDSYIKFNR
jgi:hypothetical protein